jgi:hypothetical protein
MSYNHSFVDKVLCLQKKGAAPNVLLGVAPFSFIEKNSSAFFAYNNERKGDRVCLYGGEEHKYGGFDRRGTGGAGEES